ncbi:hypothetical protein ACA910_018255 [Epithemia clementina (nom. ined.)]
MTKATTSTTPPPARNHKHPMLQQQVVPSSNHTVIEEFGADAHHDDNVSYLSGNPTPPTRRTDTKEKIISIGFPRAFPDRPSLHLIGERHSGTKWIGNHLQECFNHSVDVFMGYSTWKHWFQEQDPSYDKTGAGVVALFRNVLQWTQAMHAVPHHAPLHFGLDWNEFVTQPWTMPRLDQDVTYKNATQETCPTNIFCRYGYFKRPYQVIPCWSNRSVAVIGGRGRTLWMKPFYELRDDGSGLPFNNILALRSAKIRNFLSVQHFPNVKGFYPMRYEALMTNGTSALLHSLEQSLNVTANCPPMQHQEMEATTTTTTTRPLLEDHVLYMKQHVDWETEKLLLDATIAQS